MEKYIECLLEGGKSFTYEVYDRDFNTLADVAGWENEPDGFKREHYYDTIDWCLEKHQCVLKINELYSGSALLTLRFKDRSVIHQYLDRVPSVADFGTVLSSDVIDALKTNLGVEPAQLINCGAAAMKSMVRSTEHGWIILSREIVYGNHQTSLTFIAPKGCDSLEDIRGFLDDAGVYRKSLLPRYKRFWAARSASRLGRTQKYNNALFHYLTVLAKGYETGDFRAFFPYLSRNCTKDSQWSFDTACGYKEVTNYYRDKGKALLDSNSFPKCTIVELANGSFPKIPATTMVNGKKTEAAVSLAYTAGKLCLYLEQEQEQGTVGVIVDVDLDENYLIKSICLCMPELFNFRPYEKQSVERSEEEFSFETWKAHDFITARPLKDYLLAVKEQLIGKELSEVFSMGCIFNKWNEQPLDSWIPEHGYYEFDEPVIFDFSGVHLDICFKNTSHVKIGLNTLSMTEKSYQPYDWQNIKCLFKNVIGHKLTDIIVKTFDSGFYDSVFYGDGNRPDHGDYFSFILFVFDNGYAVDINGDWEFMDISERAPGTFLAFPTDERIMNDDTHPDGINASPTLTIVPSLNGEDIDEAALTIAEWDFNTLQIYLTDALGEFDEYDDVTIPIDKWNAALEKWKRFVAATDYDKIIEEFAGIDYSTWTVSNEYLMWRFGISGARLWAERFSDAEILDDLLVWTKKYEGRCDSIISYGY